MNTRTPKYMLIKNEFVQKIESGYYRPGDLIPSDNELMRILSSRRTDLNAYFKCKSTITQALKCLEAEGYIIRQQGKGTFVADRSKDKINLSIYLCPMDDNEKYFWISLIEQFNLTFSEFSQQHRLFSPMIRLLCVTRCCKALPVEMHRIFCPWTVLMSPIGHI